MRLVDLTLPIPAALAGRQIVGLEQLEISSGGTAYTGMLYQFSHGSMAGTYLDLPGHIKETDDGMDASTWPVGNLYRIEAAVLHLDRQSGSGAVHAEELTAAGLAPEPGGAIIINALGNRRFDDIDERSVWLALDAVRWIVTTGVRLLVSDIYESSPVLTGVFPELFAARIATVCYPVNLHLLTAPRVRLTALAPRFQTATQLPCRVVAEVPEDA